MIDPVFNAAGDILVMFSLFYLAYALKEHRLISFYSVISGLAFFLSGMAFAAGLSVIDFYIIVTLRTIILAFLMVEAVKYVIKGFEKIRYIYLIYILDVGLALFSDIPVILFYVMVIITSYLIVSIVFAFLFTFYRTNYVQALSILGFLGSIYPLFMVAYDLSAVFTPLTINILPTKLVLAAAFFSFGYCIHKTPHRFYNKKYVRVRRKK